MAFAKVANWLWIFKNRPKFQFRAHRTYILPTAFGVVFGVFALTLLLIAMGYNNNLLYLFVFFMISVAWTGMILTNQNVQRVELSHFASGDLYAQSKNQVQVWIKNNQKRPSLDVQLSGEAFSGGTKQVNAEEIQLCLCEWTPSRRGPATFPRISVSSSFPFSMLRAWKVFTWEQELIVFPRLLGDSKIPVVQEHREKESEIGVFKELRDFKNYDSVRRIDWRASARHQKILVRTYETEQLWAQRSLSWENTAHLKDTEARVSQLALWLSQAEKEGSKYSLKIPSYQSELSQGPQHFRQLMLRLALYEGQDQ